jgi:cytochrome c oxidase subunit 2
MALVFALLLWGIAAVTVGLFIGKVWWLPELISVEGTAIDEQFLLTIIVVGVVFFLAQVGLGYFIWRYRAKGDEKALYWHENPKLEATWTIATAIVFVGLGIQGNRVWSDLRLPGAPANAVQVEVTGQQFAWNFRYPGPDGKFGRTEPKLIDDSGGNPLGLDEKDPAAKDDIVVATMAVPVHRPVWVTLRSKDVTHALYSPNLRIKQDAVPGMAIPVHFTATKVGKYEIGCAELCGMFHYRMRSFLDVMTEEQFQSWLKERSNP